MKGIVLAGGSGTRLAPLTNLTNKHMLDVFDKFMVMYPLDTLVDAGITDILIITGEEHSGHFQKLGSYYRSASLTYKIQAKKKIAPANGNEELKYGGIADALALAEDFASGEKVAVILGDNIFDGDEDLIKSAFFDFEHNLENGDAVVFLKEVYDPTRFGVPVFGYGGVIMDIEEKPEIPQSNFAVVGLYLYSGDVFDVVKQQKPSGRRGELEISDVNNFYVKKGTMRHYILKKFWSDAGTHESKIAASMYMASKAGIDIEAMVKKIKY